MKSVEERKALGVPPKPLDPEQTRELVKLLQKPPKGKEQFLLDLISNRVSPGVDPAAEVKAGFLAEIVKGTKKSPLIDKTKAIELLGTMGGGYNVPPLVAALKVKALAAGAAKALSGITYVYDAFDDVAALAKAKNAAAKTVLDSWAAAEWFTSKPGIPATVKVKVFKVDGEINTDDFSPAGDASTRPDIPLHAQAMGKTRFPGGLKTIAEFRAQGFQVAFVGDVVGTGSSRKSACNSVQWVIGDDIPFVPNKKRGGVIIGGVIAPIFFATAQDSGALPIKADVSKLKTGDVVVVDTTKGELRRRAARCWRPSSSRRPPSPTSSAPAAASRSRSAARSPTAPRSSRRRGRRTCSRRSSTPSRRRARATPSPRRWSARPAASRASSPAATTSRG